MKNRLVGSAGNLEELLKLVQRYFYSQSIRFESKNGYWSVLNSKGSIDGCRVILKGKRYRFELTQS